MTSLHTEEYAGTIESVDFKAFKFMLDCGGKKYEIACDPIEMIFLIEPVCDLHPIVHVTAASQTGNAILRFKSIRIDHADSTVYDFPAKVGRRCGEGEAISVMTEK